ncbi:MAG: Hpt domain-containing protein, partial [Proteobacteria bacterium]
MNAWVVKPLSLSMLRATVLAHCSEAQGGGLAVDLEGWIDLSPAMRQLMERTLHEDIEQIEQGLRSGDGTLVQQRLHSLNGGLATVRATALSMACGQWEAALEQGPLDARASAGIKVLLERLRVVAMALREEPRA